MSPTPRRVAAPTTLSSPVSPLPASLPRRRFLRALSGGAATIGAPLWLAACGGGGDGSDPAGPAAPDAPSSPASPSAPSGPESPGTPAEPGGDPDAPTPTPLEPAARLAALRHVEDHCRALSQQQPALAPLDFLEQVAADMRALPAYADAGVDASTLSAWGLFTDGRAHVVAHSFRPQARPAEAAGAAPPARSVAALSAAPHELPAASSARVMQSFGPEFDSADVVAALAGALGGVGWQLRAGDPAHAHLDALRQVRGDGYFYINTHGGAFQPTLDPGSRQFAYSIQSSTMVTPANEALPAVQADMAARRLTYFSASNGDLILGTFPDWDTRYGVTGAFVEAYWQFAADSVVVLNACSSARTADSGWAAGFVFSCHKVGAGVVLGWTETVAPPGAYRAARWFTDRLLGANGFEPEGTPQRPFAWDEVIADMRRRGVHRDALRGAEFVALPRPGSATRQLLAPSIHHVEPDEYRDELRLHGRFGSAPGEVTIDGQPQPVLEWTDERVVCRLPAVGAGSAGPVQVTVRGLKSNRRRLTEWSIALDYTYTILEAQGLTIAGLGRVRLRADVGPTREAPGDIPVSPVRHTIATRESELPLTAAGSMPAGACTLVWSGATTYQAIPPAGQRDLLIAYLKADTAKREGWLGLGLGTPDADFVQTGCGTTTPIQPGFGTLDAPVSYPSPVEGSGDPIPLHSIALKFDGGFNIAPGVSQTVLARVAWPTVIPNHPPHGLDAV